jgi:uncharacterized protein YdeI (BOF family)
MEIVMKKLILAAVLAAPLAAPALAQSETSGFAGENAAVTQYQTQAPREFAARRFANPAAVTPAQQVQIDRQGNLYNY